MATNKFMGYWHASIYGEIFSVTIDKNRLLCLRLTESTVILVASLVLHLFEVLLIQQNRSICMNSRKTNVAMLLFSFSFLLLQNLCAEKLANTKNAFSPFTFAVLGDCRPGRSQSLTQPSVFNVMLKEISTSPAIFAVMTGDFISGYVKDDKMIKSQWSVFKKACSSIKKPFHIVAGNHDIWDNLSFDIYKSLWGNPYYDFQSNGCEFIILNSEDLQHPDCVAGPQLKWLTERLKATKDLKYRFVFIHKPLWHESKSNWNSTVHPLLVKFKVDTVFAGHEHRFANDGRSDGVRYIVTGGAGAPLRGGRGIGAFYHYLLTTVSSKEVRLKVVEPNSPESKVPPAFAGDQLTKILGQLDYKAPSIYLGESAKLAIRPKLLNSYDSPLTFHFKLIISKDSDWSCSKPLLDVELKPAESKKLTIPLVYGGGKLFPLPKLSISLEINNLKIYNRTEKVDVRFNRRITIKKATEPIMIDGKLDEQDWKGALSAGRWFNLTTQQWSEEGVVFKALRDDLNLYLSFKCHSNNIASLRKMIKKRDWYIPIEDSVLVAFYSPKIKKSKFVFGVTAHGVQSDYLASDKTTGFKWNPKWRSSVTRGTDGYIVEMAVPLSIFENKPLDKIGLKINAGRMSVSKGRRLYCWSLPLGQISDPKGFGECLFPIEKR
jgi:hypothetical protein